MLSFLKSL